MSLELLQHEFTEWMQANGFAPDAGDASEILASGKLDEKQAAYVRGFIVRWERAAEGVECWHVDTNAARIVVKDENGLPVAMVTGDPTEKSVQDSAYKIAAAPALQAVAEVLRQYVVFDEEGNLSRTEFEAMLKSVDGALLAARGAVL